MITIRVRSAVAGDLEAVLGLLKQASLPTAGVGEHFAQFLVAERDGAILGAIGLEVYGETGLLRSAVVMPSMQGRGIGAHLYDALLARAREKNIRRLLLLTNTAKEYFQRKGFRQIDQKSVSGPVTSSVEFSGACPSHAVCMELPL